MKTNLEKGFTILEVLVAMAIVGMLIAAAAFGISAVQRNSRDTQRKQVAQQVRIAYEDFYGNYGRRPGSITNTANVYTVALTSGSPSNVQATTTTFTTHATPVTADLTSCDVRETDRNRVLFCIDLNTGAIRVSLESTQAGYNIVAN